MINWKVTIAGNPIPKGRPRMVKGRVFTPERTRNYEQLVAEFAALHWHGEPTEARLSVSLRFCRETAHKCDLDNLTKSVLDGLQGVVFVDDAQIDELYIWRIIDRDNPRVEICVRDILTDKTRGNRARLLAVAQADRLNCAARKR